MAIESRQQELFPELTEIIAHLENPEIADYIARRLSSTDWLSQSSRELKFYVRSARFSCRLNLDKAGRLEVGVIHGVIVIYDPEIDAAEEVPTRLATELRRLRDSLIKRFGIFNELPMLVPYLEMQASRISDWMADAHNFYGHKAGVTGILKSDGTMILSSHEYDFEHPLHEGLVPVIWVESNNFDPEARRICVNLVAGGETTQIMARFTGEDLKRPLEKLIREYFVPKLREKLEGDPHGN